MIDHVTVDVAQSVLNVKFNNHVKVSTLVDENFKLFLDSATPVEIMDAFNEIDCATDYNSITRVLKLRVATDLEVGTPYILRIDGVQYAGSSQVITDDYEFDLTEAVTAIGEPVPQPVQIEDLSIKAFSTVDIDSAPGVSPDEFNLVSSDPEDSDFFVEQDYSNGMLALTFSSNPDPAFLTSTYIKVQRKKSQVAPARWETVPVKFSISSTEPIVYVSFPALDDPDVYKEAGYDYFDVGYTYRVRLSRYIKAA